MRVEEMDPQKPALARPLPPPGQGTADDHVAAALRVAEGRLREPDLVVVGGESAVQPETGIERKGADEGGGLEAGCAQGVEDAVAVARQHFAVADHVCCAFESGLAQQLAHTIQQAPSYVGRVAPRRRFHPDRLGVRRGRAFDHHPNMDPVAAANGAADEILSIYVRQFGAGDDPAPHLAIHLPQQGLRGIVGHQPAPVDDGDLERRRL
ncbi:MAG: hypothetical protein IH786_00060, partial [Proteobacteria bacterium]|nr:hypothetical protein [Pseudomonadota bacterium]